MQKVIVTLFVMLFISSNTYGADLFGFTKKLKKISPGDSTSIVEKKLGKADGFKTRGDFTVLNYNHKLITGWAWDRADFHVIFKNNQVVEYGMGEVREKEVNGVQTFFLFTY